MRVSAFQMSFRRFPPIGFMSPAATREHRDLLESSTRRTFCPKSIICAASMVPARPPPRMMASSGAGVWRGGIKIG